MKTKVTDEGINIPKRMLGGAEEVEIREEPDGILVVPLKDEDRVGRGRLMADALARLADSGGVSGMGDPASWERGVRRDRPLPGRDFL
jgi:hypothetical protein